MLLPKPNERQIKIKLMNRMQRMLSRLKNKLMRKKPREKLKKKSQMINLRTTKMN